MRRAGAALLALLGVVLLLVSSCTRRDGPNFVLVALDTVGAEHLGYELNGASHTPNLDQLASRGFVFQRAFSTAPWTQPSIASLFTSRMPSSHGVLRLRHVLSPEAETLAERLGDAGYETAGFVTHDLLQRKLGYAQGFGSWNEQHVGGHEAITSAELTDSVIDWLDARGSSSPFFLFVHYFDPHFAYQHHPAHDLTAGYSGPLRPGMDIWKLRNQRARLTPEDVEYLVGLYREEIGFTDGHLGRLLRHLGTLGLAEDTVIVVVADHGEEFMRHGWIGHTRTLYDELLRVPLVIHLPGIEVGREVRTPVSLLDVAPTLLELAGVAADPEAHGVSLVPFLTRDAPLPTRDLYAEVSFEAPPRDVHEEKTVFRTALMRGDLKLVHDLVTDRFTLYDRSVDPDELVDIAASHSEVDSLRAALRTWEESRGSDSLGKAELLEPDDEEMKRLRALGYVR